MCMRMRTALMIGVLVSSISSPAVSKPAPVADLRDVAILIIGHKVCHSISLRRVAEIGKRAAEREGIPFAQAQILLKRIHNELVNEIAADPAKQAALCPLIEMMNRQIP